MILKTSFRAIVRYKGKSKFDFWNNIDLDDVIEVSMELRDPGRNGNSKYATMIRFRNMRTDEKFHASLAEAMKYLEKLPHEAQE